MNILLLYATGVLGMFLLWRNGGVGKADPRSLPVATLVYASSPFFVTTVVSGNFNELMAFTFPAILLAAWKGIHSRRWFVLAAVLIAFMAFFGKFSFVWVMVSVVLMALFAVRRCWPSEEGRAVLRRVLSLLIIASGLSAVKSLPMVQLVLGGTYPMEGVGLHALQPKYYLPLAWTGFAAAMAGLPVWAARLVARWPAARVLVPAVAIVMNTGVNVATLVSELESAPPPRLDGEASFFQVRGVGMELDGMRTPHSNNYLNFLRGIGTIDWYDDGVGIPSSAVHAFTVDRADEVVPNPAYRGEAWLTDSSSGSVREVLVAANRIVVSGEVKRAGTVVVNFNHAPGWRSDHVLVNHDGLIGIRLDTPGSFEVVMRYLPTSFLVGAALSLLSLAAAFALPRVMRDVRD